MGGAQKGRPADLAGLAAKMGQFFEGIRVTEAELRAAAASGGDAAVTALLRERTEEALDRREVPPAPPAPAPPPYTPLHPAWSPPPPWRANAWRYATSAQERERKRG